MPLLMFPSELALLLRNFLFHSFIIDFPILASIDFYHLVKSKSLSFSIADVYRYVNFSCESVYINCSILSEFFPSYFEAIGKSIF